MSKQVEEMSIAELEKAIRERRRLVNKAPALRIERQSIVARIAQIDRELGQLGVTPGRREKGTSQGGVSLKCKRAPRGQLLNAILQVAGEKALKPGAIADDILERGLADTTKNSALQAIYRMAKAGKLVKDATGLYRKA